MTAARLDTSFLQTEDGDPFAFYEGVRERGDVIWDESMQAWLAVGYGVARQVLLQDERFRHPFDVLQSGEVYERIRVTTRSDPQWATGPLQRRIHQWWVKTLFTPKVVEQYQTEVIEPIVDAIVDRFAADGRVDLAEFADKVPVRIISQLLALPWQDDALMDEIKRLSDDIARFGSVANSLRDDNPYVESALRASDRLNEILAPYLEERRSGEGTDFISKVWRGGPELLPDWGMKETLQTCRSLMFGGTDTTTFTISNAFYLLLTDPRLAGELVAGGEDALRSFVEETLRLYGTVHFRPRRVTADTELGGVAIKQGQMVISVLLAANRDPGHYGCPHAVDVERERPRDHIAFSYGPHACAGPTLARAEVAECVRAALRHLPDLRLDRDAEAPRYRGMMVRRWAPLHATFAPRNKRNEQQ
jgi:cytochrome P450